MQDADSSLVRDSSVYRVIFTREASGGIIKVSCVGASSFLTRLDYLSKEVAGVLESWNGEGEFIADFPREDFLSLVSSGEAFADERYLLDCLARREYSRFDLKLRLIKRGRPETVADLVLDYIQNRGWLDDSRFAFAWLESRIKKMPEGAIALKKGLMNHGISSSLSDRILNDFFSQVSETELLKSCIEKYKKVHKNSEKNKLLQHLQRRGFSFYLINKLERIGDNG